MKDEFITDLISWFCNNFPEMVSEMKSTEHSAKVESPNPYHLEGSIWTHTMMVLKQSKTFNSPKEVIVACLLHDIGKPLALEDIASDNSEEISSKRHFKGHEGLSYFLAIDILNKMLEQNIIDKIEFNSILRMISLHGTLYNYMKDGKSKNEKDFVQKSFNYVEYMNLVELTKCDSTGRFYLSSDKNSAYKLGSEIYNADTYVNNYKHRRNKDTSLNTLELLVGLPGSGKSTYRAKYKEASIICRDDTLLKYANDKGIEGTYSEVWKSLTEDDHKEIDSLLLKNFNKLVKSETPHIIVDLTNMSPKSRRKWIGNVNKDKYFIKATILNTSLYESYERCLQRPGKKIGFDVLVNMARRFTIPSADEVDEVIML